MLLGSRKSCQRWGVLIGVLLLLAACGGSGEIQPLIFGAAPWQSGEVSSYQITDVNGDFAGTLQYEITKTESESEAGTSGWTIRRDTLAQGDQESVVVEVDAGSYTPRRALLERTGPAGTERVATSYAGSQVDMELTTTQDVTTYERNQIPSDARDQRTVVMLLRTLPLEQGYTVRLNSFLPVANLLDRVTVNVRGREEVTVPAGTFSTWRVDLDMGDSETRVWVGTEPPYPVVKFSEGRNGGLFELESFAE